MKHSLLLSLLMFVCLGVFGQSTSLPPQKVTLDALQSSIDSQQSTITTLQDSIQSLQADNADLHKQLDNLEKELDRYHDDIKTKTTTTETHISWWLVLVSIILTIVITVVVGGLGVLSPLIISRRSEKNAMIAQVQVKHSKQQVSKANDAANAAKTSAAQAQTDADAAKKIVDEAKKAVESANTSATQAQADAKAAKADADKVAHVETTVNNLVTNITKTAADAQNGFKKAKAIQYFVQALQESDENRAIELYTRCIEEDNEFAEAYNNRGILKHKIGKPSAMEDFTIAIEKKARYYEAYNNRGILYFEIGDVEKAEQDFNAAIELGYADAYLNRGLLNYKNGETPEAKKDFDLAIELNNTLAEAYYFRGLFRYDSWWDWEEGIRDIIKAKDYRPNIVETYPNRSLLTGNMKELDNFINGVDYSKDMTKLIRVPQDKEGKFIVLTCVNEIANYAFENCFNITSVEISDSVKVIGYEAFSGCINLVSINIPNNVTKIGEGAFGECKSLKSIKIPKSVTEIGNHSFGGCKGLVEIIVDKMNPNYCSKEGILYSRDMSKIIAVPSCKDKINIPFSLNTFVYGAFNDCTNLQEIVVDKQNPNFSSMDGALYSKDMSILISVPKGRNSILISDRTTKIGYCAFENCDQLTSIVIPNSVTMIEDRAFAGCTRLNSIFIPSKVTKIGNYAFQGCKGLERIIVDEKNLNYCSKDGALYSKDMSILIAFPGGEESINIPNTVTKIGNYAFLNCSNRTSIVIPECVTEIEGFSFLGCDNPKEIHLKHKDPIDFSRAFSLCIDVSEVTLYVPKGSDEAYRKHEFYKGFKEIIEE